jgi:hypothetical protein
MAAWLPIPSGFTGFAHRFVDPAFGFALGMFSSQSMCTLTDKSKVGIIGSRLVDTPPYKLDVLTVD